MTIDPETITVTELEHVHQTRREAFGTEAKVKYYDHQPGDATRYVLIAFDLQGKGAAMSGVLGYVSKDAVFAICGMTGYAYLFQKGDNISEYYIEEKFGLRNPHSIHHYAELVADAIEGTVVGCRHNVRSY